MQEDYICSKCNTLVETPTFADERQLHPLCPSGHPINQEGDAAFRFFGFFSLTNVIVLAGYGLAEVLLRSRLGWKGMADLMRIPILLWLCHGGEQIWQGVKHWRMPRPAQRLAPGMIGAGLGIFFGFALSAVLIWLFTS